MISSDGQIYEGTPLESKGVHVKQANTGKIGIALMGDYHPDFLDLWDMTKPSQKQLDSLFMLVNVLKEVYGIEKVNKHSDFLNTKCPGEVLTKIIKDVY